MLQLKIGIRLASLRQPLKKALHTAASMGVAGVEIDARDEVFSRDLTDTALRQLRKMLDDLNLRACAVSFQTRRGYHELEDLERRVAATMRAQRLAYALGASVVVNQVGVVPDQSQGREWETLVDSLTELGRYGQHVGALLAAETGSEPAADLERLLKAISNQGVVVDLNPGKLIVNGFSAREAVDLLGPRVAHVHALDGVRDLAQGRGVEVPLGRGAVEFPELLGRLEHHQYQGFFTVARYNAVNPVDELRQAVSYLKSL